MSEETCPICSSKHNKPDRSGLYKYNEQDLFIMVCFVCGWKSESSHNIKEINLPTKIELLRKWE